MAANKIAKVALYIIYTLAVGWLLLLIANLYDVLYNEDQYNFGINEYSKHFKWVYASKLNYLIYLISNVSLTIAIIAIGWLRKHSAAFVIFITYLFFILYFLEVL